MLEPTFVLVHGAWGGQWCWRDLSAELDERGVAWRSMDLPSSRMDAAPGTNLDDDADAVIEATLDAGRVVLVGHSYGGAVITQAAPRIADLSMLIYVAALVTAPGESATDASRLVRTRTLLDGAMSLDGEYLRLDASLVPAALYGHCSDETQRWATAKISTQTLASFRTPRSAHECETSSRYILCRDDRAVDPSLQEELAKRCDELVTLDSDHSPFLSHPTQLADLLLS